MDGQPLVMAALSGAAARVLETALERAGAEAGY